MPSLRVGLHVVLVEGRPVLPASTLSQLVDGNGALRTDMAAIGTLISFSRKARRQLAAEITAQFEAFRATGLKLDHCNAHKHFHLHPVVGGLMAAIGARFGLARGARPARAQASAAQDRAPHAMGALAHNALCATAAPALAQRRPARAGSDLRTAMVGTDDPGPSVRPDPPPAARPERDLPASRHRLLRRIGAQVSLPGGVRCADGAGSRRGVPRAFVQLGGFSDFLAAHAAGPVRSSIP